MQSTGVAGGTLYDLILYAPPGGNGSVYVRIERVGTQYAADYALTPTTPGVQTPGNTTFLYRDGGAAIMLLRWLLGWMSAGFTTKWSLDDVQPEPE
jgi:hypothetical protein